MTADPRSEENILTLDPAVQEVARRFLEQANDSLKESGLTAKIISGTRSYAEQDLLYAKGRTTPGRRVTNAPGGHSNHNFGIAFDIGLFRGKSYLPESHHYQRLGQIGKGLGLEWGGDWRRFTDEPHYQMRPNWAEDLTERQMLAVMRRRVETHQDLFA